MLFPSCDTAVTDWTQLVPEVIGGTFWEAKISLSSRQNAKHVFCVYTTDFADVADVFATARRLKDLGITHRKPVYYKPDVFTLDGIYGRGASIYRFEPKSDRLTLEPGFARFPSALRDQMQTGFANLRREHGWPEVYIQQSLF